MINRVTSVKRDNRKDKLKFLKKDVLYDLYITQHKTMAQIALIYNVSPASILHKLNKFNIKTRKANEYVRRKLTQAEKNRISKVHKGKTVSDETRKKISEGHKIHTAGHKKIRKDGYVAVYYPNHPNSNKSGYIMEHHLVMEKVLGRHLRKGEIVHHKNFIKTDNRPENLQVMTPSEHMKLHAKLRKERKGA